MFGLAPLPMYAIIFLLVTNGLSFLFWQMADSRADRYKDKAAACAAQHDAFVAQSKAQGQIATEKAKQKEAENERISKSTAKGWAAAVVAVRADRDNLNKRLRESASRSAGGSGLSAPTQDRPGDAQAGTDTIPSPERVAADCAETTITLNYVQSYIERLEGVP